MKIIFYLVRVAILPDKGIKFCLPYRLIGRLNAFFALGPTLWILLGTVILIPLRSSTEESCIILQVSRNKKKTESPSLWTMTRSVFCRSGIE